MDKKSVQKLMAKKGVVSVGEGIKVKDGKSTGQYATVIGVTKKVPSWQLKKKDLIPDKVGHNVTDVVEIGEIKMLGLEAQGTKDRTDRWRPCMAGVSVGHYNVTAGTLGAWIKKSGVYHILSNNHVLANVNEGKIGDNILQPGRADGGTMPADLIGVLSDFAPISIIGEETDCSITNILVAIYNFISGLFGRKSRISAYLTAEANKVDCAIAQVNPTVEVCREIMGLGYIEGEAEVYVGDQVTKAGRTSGITVAPVKQKNVTVSVQMGSGKVAVFEDQLLIQGDTPFSQPGDSGSAVLNMKKQIVGLLFAGSDTVTIVNRYANVKEALGIDYHF